jgi:two-component system, OmpR family, alkaline phosphatase synthesis response regulator PhoP
VSKKILIVDDERNVTRMLGYFLEQEGYEILVVRTGMEALEKIGTEKPDLIILDIMMPDMSGFEVCEQVRKNPETFNLPVIMFSALSDSKNENRGHDAGADEYLSKLVGPDILLTHVATLLERTQSNNTPK